MGIHCSFPDAADDNVLTLRTLLMMMSPPTSIHQLHLRCRTNQACSLSNIKHNHEPFNTGIRAIFSLYLLLFEPLVMAYRVSHILGRADVCLLNRP